MRGVVPVSLGVQVLSLASSVVLARVLGATTATDAYYLGLSVPVFVYGALVGALRQAAIPALTSVSDSSVALTAASGELMRGVTAVATVATVLAVGASEAALPLVAHGQLLSETRLILLELTPYGILGALTGVLSAILAVRGSFLLPVAVVGLESIVKVVLMVAFGRGLGVQSLVLGNLVGGAGAVVVLVLVARRLGVFIGLRGRVDSPFVRSAVRLSAPLIISLSVLQVNPVIDRTMTSGLGKGEVTALSLGLRLFVAPAGLVTSLLIAPITATWAARFAHDGWPALQASARRMVEVAARVVPPMVVLGIVLRRQIVDLALSGGAFPPSALRNTAAVLGMSFLALPAQTLVVALAALFVVRSDTVFPMKVAFANVVLNIVLNFALRRPLGVGGIALSTSLTMSILVIAYLVEVRRRWGGLGLDGAALLWRSALVVAGLIGVSLALLDALPHAHSRVDAAAALGSVGMAGIATTFAVLAAAGDSVARRVVRSTTDRLRSRSRDRRRPTRRDVVFYLPAVRRLVAGADLPAGGAETQVVLLAGTLARRGARVALVVEPACDDLPKSLDGVELIVRPRSRAELPLVGRVHETFAILLTLLRAPSRVIVTRVAGQQVGIIAIFAKILGRRHVHATANDFDFDLVALGFRGRDRLLYRLGLRLADQLVVQTENQRRLCLRRFGRAATVAPSIAVLAERCEERDAFLWAGRLVSYKRPLAFVALARALPEARFRMVGVPTSESADLQATVERAAAQTPNLEILPPQTRAALLDLIARSTAVVSTSEYEGFSNVLLEGWARGVPALSLHHDPDGVIDRFGLGEFASGSEARLEVAARRLWFSEEKADVERRCLEYVRRAHAPEIAATVWEAALGLAVGTAAGRGVVGVAG